MSASAETAEVTRYGRMTGAVATAVLAAFILIGTLTPAGPAGSEATTWCGLDLVCGARGTADALVNVVLFLPLGVALLPALGSWRRALVVIVLFSTAIEATQVFVPGRYTSLGDVVFDSIGGGLGVLVAASVGRWLYPDPRLRPWLAGGALAAALGWVAVTGWMDRPDVPPSPFFVQWTPEPAFGKAYDGHVVDASLGGEVLRQGIHRAPPSVEEAMDWGAPLTVSFVAGTRPAGFLPIVRFLGVHGGEITQVGVVDADLVFHVRKVADWAGLEDPSLRFRDAMKGIRPGEVVTLRIRKQPDGAFCFALEHGSTRVECGRGLTAGTGWALLIDGRSLPGWLVEGLDIFWLAALLAPVGALSGSLTGMTRAAAAALLALLLLPGAVGLLPTPGAQLGAALLGLLSGGTGAWVLRRSRLFARDSLRASAVSLPLTP